MVPRFAAAADAMTNADTAPPVLTQKVLSISAHMQIYWHAYVIILVVLLLLDVFIYRAFNSTSKAGAQI
jgi:type II secretory pathway component PulF